MYLGAGPPSHRDAWREIDPNGPIQCQQYNAWLDSCRLLHGHDCDPEFTEELYGIRLVDVETRTIVAYPGEGCEYAALSYVWGGVEQKSYHLGSRLDEMPRTLEDALTCAKLLGKRYLWVDSLCIDQSDDAAKAEQIGRMWSIYRGSSITIIALSSTSAASGLPRLCPDLPPQPQLQCTIDGVRLVALMPTLSQAIWTEMWGSRAWTLQEALLSHRCLYLSDHQLYFECEVMQYSEALDTRRSWAHGLQPDATPDATPDRRHWQTWVMEQNGSGCLRNLLDTPADRLLHWGQKVTLYSYRDMTKQDGLRAFSGVLQRLQVMYEQGFFWGLPIEDFQWALLWQAQWPPQRRPGFPTWSWAGWKAGIMTLFPSDITNPHRSPVPLRAWKAVGDKLELLFDAQARAAATSKRSADEVSDRTEAPTNPNEEAQGQNKDESEIQARYQDRRDEYALRTDVRIEQAFNLPAYEDAEDYRALFLEALTVQFQPDWSKPRHERPVGGLRGYFEMEVAGVLCLIHMMTSDTMAAGQPLINGAPKYLLLALDARGGHEELHILVVHDLGAFCGRGTSLSLLVPREHAQEVVQALKLQRQYIVLA